MVHSSSQLHPLASGSPLRRFPGFGQIACVSLLAIAAPLKASAAEPPVVVQASIQGYEPERQIVSLAVGRETGVALGDSAFLFQEADLQASAKVFFVADRVCSARLEGAAAIKPGSGSAVILRASAVAGLRDALPPGVTLRGIVDRLPPGRQTAWLSIGARSGLRQDDRIMIRRGEIPVARGRISVLSDDTSLTTLQPVVGNAVTESGDTAELWPEPADQQLGRLRTSILATQPAEDGTVLTIVGTVGDGLIPDRLLDLYHDDRQIGVASVMDTYNPISMAKVVTGATRQPPAVGDQAWMRSPAGPPVRPLAAPVFLVEGEQDYCLIAAGEADGLQRGDKLIVRRPDAAQESPPKDIAELTVDKVNIDYTGAFIRRMNTEGLIVAQWDIAERRTPRLPEWRPVGVVNQVRGSVAIADVDLKAPLVAGAVVRLRPESQKRLAGAVVLRRERDAVILHVPPGWGDPESLIHARMEIHQDRPETRPAQQPPPRANE